MIFNIPIVIKYNLSRWCFGKFNLHEALVETEQLKIRFKEKNKQNKKIQAFSAIFDRGDLVIKTAKTIVENEKEYWIQFQTFLWIARFLYENCADFDALLENKNNLAFDKFYAWNDSALFKTAVDITVRGKKDKHKLDFIQKNKDKVIRDRNNFWNGEHCDKWYGQGLPDAWNNLLQKLLKNVTKNKKERKKINKEIAVFIEPISYMNFGTHGSGCIFKYPNHETMQAYSNLFLLNIYMFNYFAQKALDKCNEVEGAD